MKTAAWQAKPYGQTFLLDKETESVFRWHHHNYCEIFVVSEGHGMTAIGDYTGEIHPGEAYLLGPFVPHAFYMTDNPQARGASVTFYLGYAQLDQLSAAMPELAVLVDLHERSRRGLLFAQETGNKVLKMLENSAGSKGVKLAVLMLEILNLFAEATDVRPLASSASRIVIDDAEYRKVNAISEYLLHNYTKPVRLAEVAAQAKVSESTLCRLFRRNIGKTVVEYVNELRISHACRLLAETDVPIMTIAAESGFNTLSNFNRTFLRMKKMTPNRFRRSGAGRPAQ